MKIPSNTHPSLQGVYAPSVVSGREVVFFEDRVGGLAAHIAGGLAATATSYEAAARAGLLNRTTVQEVSFRQKPVSPLLQDSANHGHSDPFHETNHGGPSGHPSSLG